MISHHFAMISHHLTMGEYSRLISRASFCGEDPSFGASTIALQLLPDFPRVFLCGPGFAGFNMFQLSNRPIKLCLKSWAWVSSGAWTIRTESVFEFVNVLTLSHIHSIHLGKPWLLCSCGSLNIPIWYPFKSFGHAQIKIRRKRTWKQDETLIAMDSMAQLAQLTSHMVLCSEWWCRSPHWWGIPPNLTCFLGEKKSEKIWWIYIYIYIYIYIWYMICIWIYLPPYIPIWLMLMLLLYCYTLLYHIFYGVFLHFMPNNNPKEHGTHSRETRGHLLFANANTKGKSQATHCGDHTLEQLQQSHLQFHQQKSWGNSKI